MWLPTPIYERIPQFWFLLGLLFFATGLFLGFEFELAFWYLAIGFACAVYGIGVFVVRLRYRRNAPVASQPDIPEEPVHPDPSPGDPLLAE